MNTPPDFSLSRIQKTALILSAGLIILNYLFMSLSSFIFPGLHFSDSTNLILSAFFFAAYCIIYYTLLRFFKYKELQPLVSVTVANIFLQVLVQAPDFINFYKKIVPVQFELLAVLLSFFAEITLIILVLRLTDMNSAPFRSLKHFAKNQVWAIVLSLVYNLCVTFGGYESIRDLMYIPFAIPYFFIIHFALQEERREAEEY